MSFTVKRCGVGQIRSAYVMARTMVLDARQARRLRPVCIVLAALAIFVRLVVPSGFMLAGSGAANGLPTLVICTGQGAMAIAVDAQGMAVRGEPGGEKGKNKGGDHPCAFAGASTAQTAPLLVGSEHPFEIAQVDQLLLRTTQRPGLGLAAPPPPTTGPPTIF